MFFKKSYFFFNAVLSFSAHAKIVTLLYNIIKLHVTRNRYLAWLGNFVNLIPFLFFFGNFVNMTLKFTFAVCKKKKKNNTVFPHRGAPFD